MIHSPLLSLVEGCSWGTLIPWHYWPGVHAQSSFLWLLKNSSESQPEGEEHADVVRPRGQALLPLGGRYHFPSNGLVKVVFPPCRMVI